MIHTLTVLACLALAPAMAAADFRPFANFILKSQYKVTGERITPILIKPIAFQVFTDGTRVRITVDGDSEARSTFEIYRSDGVGRRRPGVLALDVIPGVQAMNTRGGVVRHLRLTRESFTITTFPGVSDQTIITHAVATKLNPPATSKSITSTLTKP